MGKGMGAEGAWAGVMAGVTTAPLGRLAPQPMTGDGGKGGREADHAEEEEMRGWQAAQYTRWRCKCAGNGGSAVGVCEMDGGMDRRGDEGEWSWMCPCGGRAEEWSGWAHGEAAVIGPARRGGGVASY